MKTLSTKESRASSPVTRRAHSAVHTPLGAKNRIQQNHIRQILQPKLIIGQSNDKYEQEADSVADRVVANQPVAEISSISGSLSSLGNQNFQVETGEDEQVQEKEIQRQAEEDEEEPVQPMLIQRQAEEEDEEQVQPKLIQRQAEEEDEEQVQPRLIQRQAEEEADDEVQAKGTIHSAQAASQAVNNQSSGSFMRPDVRNILESGTGADLSAVRVHEDSSAHQAAASINAKAFTHKNDIWLGADQSQSDLHLMAHEATHVVQQGGGLRAADARARQVSASPQRAPDTDAAVQHSGETSTTMVQRSLFDDVAAGLGVAWDATGGALVDAAGNALDMGAEYFWIMLATLAPALVPLLREIADKGIFTFLYEKLAAVLDGIFDRLENRGGVIATLAQTFRGLAAQATGILAALASGDCEPLFAALSQFKEMVSQVAGDAWNAITEFFAPVEAFFSDLWTSFGAPLVDWLQGSAADLWEWIQNLGTQIWNWTQPVRDKLGAAWDWVKDQLGFGGGEEAGDGEAGLVGWVKGKAAEAWDAIKEKLQPVIEPMQAVVGKVQAVLPLDAIFNLRETVTGWLDNVGEMTTSLEAEDGAAENQASLREEILPAVLNTIESLREGLVSTGHWVSGNIGAIAMTLQGLFDSLRVNPVLGSLSGGLQWLSDSLDTLTGWVQEYAVGVFTLYSHALGLLSRFVEPVLNGLQKVAEVLGNIAGKLPDLILGPVWWLMPKCIKDPIKDFLLNTILAQIPIFNQILVIPDIWEKVKSTAMTILTKVFVDGDLIGAAWTYFKAILSIIGIPAQLVVSIVKHAVTALSDILKDPIGFLLNILKAIKQGFVQFFGNILKHLYNGVVDWLFGAVSEAGLTPPADFSLKSVLDFVLQILDITRERILERMEKHPKIGKKVVDRLRAGFEVADKAWEWVKVLFTEGPAGLWEKLKENLSGLWSNVIGSIVSWMSTKIIEQATIKLLTFLDPSFIMAFVNSVIFIYKAIQSFVQYINEMLEMINSVFAGIGDIAKGAIGNAANYLEQTMADSIPIVIGFLANQFGLGQISRRIGDMVESVRGRVDAAIDGLINLVVTAGSAFLNMLRSGAAAVKEGVKGLVEWWRKERVFSTKKGEQHKLYYTGSGKDARLMVASNEESYEAFINNADADISATGVNENLLEQAAAYNRQVLQNIAEGREPSDNIIDRLESLTKTIIEGMSSEPKGTKENPYLIRWHKALARQYQAIRIRTEPGGTPQMVNPLQETTVTVEKNSVSLAEVRQQEQSVRDQEELVARGGDVIERHQRAIEDKRRAEENRSQRYRQLHALGRNQTEILDDTDYKGFVAQKEAARIEETNTELGAQNQPGYERDLRNKQAILAVMRERAGITTLELSGGFWKDMQVRIWNYLSTVKAHTVTAVRDSINYWLFGQLPTETEPIGIAKERQVYVGKVVGPSKAGPSPRAQSKRFVAFLKQADYDWAPTSADHVVDLSFGGPDHFRNLWPVNPNPPPDQLINEAGQQAPKGRKPEQIPKSHYRIIGPKE